jgi:3-hydroxyisobutyrate dehydrogenase
MNKVFSAISNGAAQSWQMDNRFNTMVNNKFDFGFAVDLMIKDLKIALGHSKSHELNLSISKSVLKKYELLSSNNSGNLDTSSLVKLFDV